MNYNKFSNAFQEADEAAVNAKQNPFDQSMRIHSSGGRGNIHYRNTNLADTNTGTMVENNLLTDLEKGDKGSMKANVSIEGENVTTSYQTEEKGNALNTESAETTIVRTDEKGNEVYRHVSNRPELAMQVGVIAANAVRQAAEVRAAEQAQSEEVAAREIERV